MNLPRKFGVGLLATVLSFSVVGLVWSHITLITVYNRGTIKGWLRHSGAYDKIADIVLDSSRKEQGGSSPLTAVPDLQKVAADSFSPAYLQENAEYILNSLYDWLEGKADKLEFSIDLTTAKAELADGVAKYVTEQAAGLPVCTSKSTDSFEVINSGCLPPGMTAAQAGALAREDILTNPEFLPDSSFSSDSIKLKDGDRETGLNDNQNLARVRTVYQKAQTIPPFLTLMALLSAAGVVFISLSRRRGLRKVGFVLVTSGVLIGLSYLAATRGVSLIQQKLSEQTGGTESARELGGSIIGLVGSDIRGLLGLYALGFLLTGVALIVACHFIKQDSKPEPKNESVKTDTPEKPEEVKEPKEDTKEPPEVQL